MLKWPCMVTVQVVVYNLNFVSQSNGDNSNKYRGWSNLLLFEVFFWLVWQTKSANIYNNECRISYTVYVLVCLGKLDDDFLRGRKECVYLANWFYIINETICKFDFELLENSGECNAGL